MKKFLSSGVSMTELMISMGILAALALGGMTAYDFFTKGSKSELDKLGDVGEFTNVAKDLLKFAEGAGVSTAYLNLPVLTKNCVDNLPCIRKLQGADTFIVPPETDLPERIKALTCTQFYKEGQGSLVRRAAFPSLGLPDVLTQVNDMEVRIDPSIELYTHWPLATPSSPPLLMMKTKEGGVYLSMYKKPAVEHSRKANEARSQPLKHAFFESDSPPDKVLAMKGEAFLIFNTVYPSHFAIQYAEDILDCTTNPAVCLTEVNKAMTTDLTDLNTALDPQTGFRMYAVRLSPIDQKGDAEKKYVEGGTTFGFFSRIREAMTLPSECPSTWSVDNEQDKDEFFFPTRVFSVSNPGEVDSDLADSTKPLNVLHLNHYYGSDKMAGVSGTMDRGLIVALPIEISTYSIEQVEGAKGLDLVMHTWHSTDIKRKVSIRDIKGPFTVTRKVGSSEVGIWYNPLTKKTTGGGQ